ncbi:thyrotropin-releasing hormone receptor-like isoform X1 [Leucoraja erinacea]|uniref:thyrotropin-releasing hormone receptor-like isoform X1 n=1 Tax=Leucoraja erinaceus TaxID=7782 RepID=UPI002457D4A0|nr:thyrotropin-releasing hormone receptor-like isoform X1 [Leucoraja erinacea]
MAMADLLVIITDVLLRTVFVVYFPRSFLNITPVCSTNVVLAFAATLSSDWFTVAFTLDRFLAICYQNVKIKYCTERTATVIMGIVSVFSCLISVPWYFTMGPEYNMDNIPRGCVLKQAFLNLTSWASFELLTYSLIAWFPFFLLMLLNSLTARHILMSGRVRRGLRGRNTGDNDPEMENRRKSVVLLFCISGSFLLLWSTEVIYVLSERVFGIPYVKGSDFESVGFMLQVLSTCTNTVIYVLTQNKFREQMKSAVRCPIYLIVKLLKTRNAS